MNTISDQTPENFEIAEVSFEHKKFKFFHFNKQDHIFRKLLKGHFYEEDFLKDLRRFIKPKDLILDIGANIGNHSIFFAGVCGARVIAFEPNPEALTLLRAAVAANNLTSQIEIHPIGLGASDGNASFDFRSSIGNLGGVRLREGNGVTIRKLDGLALPDSVRLIKIDTEGMDAAVIMGARAILQKDRPLIAVEGGHVADYQAIWSALQPHKYFLSGFYNYTLTHLFIPQEVLGEEEKLGILSALGGLLGVRQAENYESLRIADQKHLGDSLKSLIEKNEEFLQNIEKISLTLNELEVRQKADRSAMETLLAELARAMGASMAELNLKLDYIAAGKRFVSPSEDSAFDRAAPATPRLALQKVLKSFLGAHKKVPEKAQGAPPRAPSVEAHVKGSPSDLIFHPLVKFSLPDSWKGLKPFQAAELGEKGKITLRSAEKTPGAISDPVSVEGSTLIRVRALVANDAATRDSRPHLRVFGDDGQPLGPDYELRDGGIKSRIFFIPHRVKTVTIHLIAHKPKEGGSFSLKSLQIDRVDPENHYQHVRMGEEEPIIASLASIPSRAGMLRDAVMSLLCQCDQVRVFLNGYGSIPDFLDHPRIAVRRSEDYDDKGDAGKFGWIDEDGDHGYRLIADDDLVFSPDYARAMVAAVRLYRRRAIVGLHGVILRQPVSAYYDPQSRHAFHFQYTLKADRTVHMVGAGTICYHASAVKMRWDDFMHRNMADIFLSLYAQRNAIPMVALARPAYFVRQNTQKDKFDTIYDQSLHKTGSAFDSSAVQDALVKRNQPFFLRRTALRERLTLVLIASSAEAMHAAVTSFLETRSTHYDWSLILVPAHLDAAMHAGLDQLRPDIEMISVVEPSHSLAARVNRVLTWLEKVDSNATLVALDRIRFTEAGWDKDILALADTHSIWAFPADDPQDGRSPALSPGDNTSPASHPLLLFGPRIGRRIRHFPLRGGTLENVWRDWLARNEDLFRPGTDETALASVRRLITLHPAAAVYVDTEGSEDGRAPLAAPSNLQKLRLRINDFFDRVLVLNLDRRPDRWQKASERLRRAGIDAVRFPAVDGQHPRVREDFEAYSKAPLLSYPSSFPPLPLSSPVAFYHGAKSQTARAAFLEARDGCKAIRTAGAWGYLKSMEKIFTDALHDRVESLLVFDDDLVLHKNTPELFTAAVGSIPDDWMILQLGTLQYYWSEPLYTPCSRFTYATHGCAIGSHAVGYRFDVFPFMLDQIRHMQMPFDIGALSAATKAFADRCLVVTPNIAIQDIGDSDIGSSDFQQSRTLDDVFAHYRWVHEDYDF